MKRGGPLKRTKGLDGGEPLRRSTPLRSGHSREGRAKPTKRKVVDGPSEAELEDAAKKAARKRSGGDCEIRTPWCQGRAREFSHRKAEGQGGQWAASNGLDACGHGNLDGCHGYCHQHPEEARENGWFISAYSKLPASEIPAWIWHKGRRAKYLLDDEGEAVLAPFPQGDPRHPDDIPWSPPAAPLDGVA
jgi:hypothetical protein